MFLYVLGEAVNVKEENVVEEAEPEAAVEAKVLSPIADEKNQNDKEVFEG